MIVSGRERERESERGFFAASSKNVTNGFKEICFISKQRKKEEKKKKLLSRKTRFIVFIQTAAKKHLNDETAFLCLPFQSLSRARELRLGFCFNLFF